MQLRQTPPPSIRPILLVLICNVATVWLYTQIVDFLLQLHSKKLIKKYFLNHSIPTFTGYNWFPWFLIEQWATLLTITATSVMFTIALRHRYSLNAESYPKSKWENKFHTLITTLSHWSAWLLQIHFPPISMFRRE